MVTLQMYFFGEIQDLGREQHAVLTTWLEGLMKELLRIGSPNVGYER